MKDNLIVAIHQPNFFPWLGYFNKIIRSDIFVFMDNVAFPQTSSGCFINRVKVLIQGKAAWITCPIVRIHGGEVIKDVRIYNDIAWREKILKTLELNYKKCLFFNEIIEWLKPLLENKEEKLSVYNISNIREICYKLGIKKQFILHSDLETQQKSTDLLIEITKNVNGTAYLCGGGAPKYQEDFKFSENGLELIYQNFVHPIYEQKYSQEFVSGLSIIDCLMNLGIDGTKKLLSSSLGNR
ncbi:MAG: WbqC family protein [Bacteroidota bacterium]